MKTGTYHATSCFMEVAAKLDDGFFLEYNPHIHLWRINHESGKIPVSLMGYSPHRTALEESVSRWVKRDDTNK